MICCLRCHTIIFLDFNREETVNIENEILELANKITPFTHFDFPIAAYIVSKEGKFLNCNEQLRKILELPEVGYQDFSIAKFYKDPEIRNSLLKDLEKPENKNKWTKIDPIEFVVNNKIKFLKLHCCGIRDSNNQLIGFMGFIEDFTEQYLRAQFFNKLALGFYKLDANDNFEHISPEAAFIFGSSVKELLNKPVSILWSDKERLKKFKQKLIEIGFILNHKEKLKTREGDLVIISVNVMAIRNHDGSYAGRIGTITDITKGEFYRSALVDVPLGYYMERVRDDGEEYLEEWNKQFAEMFRIKKDEKPFPVKEIFYDEKSS